ALAPGDPTGEQCAPRLDRISVSRPGGRGAMRIVALEEHYTVPSIVSRIDPAAIRGRGFPGPDVVWGQTLKRNELAQLGDARIADMDASGITLQVLSVAGPGADVVPGPATESTCTVIPLA